MRRPLCSSATFVTRDLLGLPKGSLLARYTHLIFVFAFSGLLHMVGHVAEGSSLSASADVFQFFVTQGAGIMVEDGLSALYRRWIISEERSRLSRSTRAAEMVSAYAWVLLFLTWSTPVWLYNIAVNPSSEPFLPFSIVRKLA